jgi:hypothetical protein
MEAPPAPTLAEVATRLAAIPGESAPRAYRQRG